MKAITNVVSRLRRLEVPAVALIGLTVVFTMVFDNGTFWTLLSGLFAEQPIPMMVLAGALVTASMVLLLLFSNRLMLKPVLAGWLILGAASSFYVDTLGVVMNQDMIQNILTTTVTESKHLMTPAYVWHLLTFGVAPAILVLLLRVRNRGLVRNLATNSMALVACLALTGMALMSNYRSYTFVFREHSELMRSLQPIAPLEATISYSRMIERASSVVVTQIGTDAVKGPTLSRQKTPVVTVLVIGETARAQNFGLDGYERDTTPELRQRNVVNFSDAQSCGTATAVSLPCMFSKYDRPDYSYEKGVSTENLVDVLVHAGVRVDWLDNNTGDKGIAANIPYQYLSDGKNAVHCAAGECRDGILVDALQARLDTITDDTVLILHQIGSHGPSYYLRYPSEYAVYQPACDTAQVQNCTAEEVRNAYDNTIAYTDHVLAQMIDLLKTRSDLETALLYVSDHGESLGENGLYLHGAPYFIAPEVQTHVPMVLWLSEPFKTAMGIDQDCLKQHANEPVSHDNLFHSVLGMIDVVTSERNDGMDLFSSCHTSGQTTAG